MALPTLADAFDFDDLPEPTDDDLAALDAELERERLFSFDARDAQLAFIIRASIEDAALATIAPWSAEPPY